MLPKSSWFSFASRAQPKTLIDDKTTTTSDGMTKDVEEDNSSTLSFGDIVSRFNDLQEQVTELQAVITLQENEIRRQDETVRTQKTTIDRLSADLLTERASTAALQLAICDGSTHRRGTITKQQPDNAPTVQPFIQHLSSQRKKQRKEVKDLRERNQGVVQSLNAHQRRVIELEQILNQLKEVNTELKFDIEYHKCVSVAHNHRLEGSKDSQDAGPVNDSSTRTDSLVTLPEAPFVLVLIDGDAYSFLSKGPSPDPSQSAVEIHPATRISRAIRTALQHYILSNDLPAHSKMMVRVLQNIGFSRTHHRQRRTGLLGSVKRGPLTISRTEDFMIQFTESSPLFDYVDAGTGKERVDGKIHELYNLFLPNPSCKKIFLATATDNGFARMLEQHIDRPESRAKTCLISPGVVASEIALLDLEIIEWPTVFQMRYSSNPKTNDKMKTRKRREEQLSAALKKEQDELVRVLGRRGYERKLMDMGIAVAVQDWMGGTEKIMAGTGSGVVGLVHGRGNVEYKEEEVIDQGCSDVVHSTDKYGSFCLEEGVD